MIGSNCCQIEQRQTQRIEGTNYQHEFTKGNDISTDPIDLHLITQYPH